MNLSHVLFKSAYIHDVAAIAAKARSVGAITIIDGYQAVGTIPVDVRALGIDVYIGGCLKWLCGGPGAAFVWVDPRAAHAAGAEAHRLDGPPAAVCVRARDWRAATMPGGSSMARPVSRPSTRRGPGLEIVNEIGIEAIRAKSLRQTGRLLELADQAGYRCTTPRDPARRGGTVAIDVENGYEISKSLKSLDILCDYRRRGNPALTAFLQSRRRARRRHRGHRRDPSTGAGGPSRPGNRL